MRRLKTLHLNTERTWRGGEQQTLYLASGLEGFGHLARVCCVPGGALSRRARKAGLEVVEIPARGELDWLAAWRISRHLKREGYDIFHMHTSHAHGLGILVSVFHRGPRRVVHRRVDFSIFRNRLKLSRYKYARDVDRYVAISEAVKAVMVEDGIPEGKISVVPSGVDPTRLEQVQVSRAELRKALEVPEDAPLVGCVGHLAWHKGQEFLVRAVPELLEQVPDAWVVIVGEGERRALLEGEIKRLGVGHRVRMTGFREDAPTLMRAFDVLAVPSVMEGLNTTVLDAQCLGVPVVASQVGGLPEAVQEGAGGVLVPPRIPGALARALAALLQDRARREDLGRRGSARVRRDFSVERMVEGNLAVYGDLLGEEAMHVQR